MHETANPVYEQLVIASANKSIVGGAATATASGAAVQLSWIVEHGTEIASACSIAGILVAVIGLAVSVYYQMRRNYREDAEFKRRMRSDYRG